MPPGDLPVLLLGRGEPRLDTDTDARGPLHDARAADNRDPAIASASSEPCVEFADECILVERLGDDGG